MKFTKGMILGSMLTVGIMMMYSDDNMNTKKMMMVLILYISK